MIFSAQFRAAERLHGEVPPALVPVREVIMLKTKSYFKILLLLGMREILFPSPLWGEGLGMRGFSSSNSIHSQAWLLKMADQKRASKTARLECCAVWEIRRVKTKKNPFAAEN